MHETADGSFLHVEGTYELDPYPDALPPWAYRWVGSGTAGVRPTMRPITAWPAAETRRTYGVPDAGEPAEAGVTAARIHGLLYERSGPHRGIGGSGPATEPAAIPRPGGSSQKAFDAQGAEYSNDGVAEMYANKGNATFLETINPGNQVKGRLVFDVPKNTTLTEVMLHDSPFSGGVRVNLA